MDHHEYLSNNSRLKVIIAESNPDIAAMLIPALANENFTAIGCSAVNEVLEYEHDHIDALLVNVDFDDYSGSQLIEHVRQLPIGKSIPIIAYSNSEDSNDVLDTLNSGADDYLLMPFTARDVALKVRQIAGGKNA